MPVARGGTFIVGNDIARFWSKTALVGSCIVWTGGVDKDGYGKFVTGPARQQVTHRSHRWIYEAVVSPIGERYLLHSCDNPPCVTLQHLSPGTQRQNIADSIAKGRSGTNAAIIDEAKAGEIKWLYENGAAVVDMARGYGISKQTVYAILSGRKWKQSTRRAP